MIKKIHYLASGQGNTPHGEWSKNYITWQVIRKIYHTVSDQVNTPHNKLSRKYTTP